LGQDILVYAILIIGTLLAFIYLPAFFMKRAMAEVRQIFYRHGAIGVENAKSVDELGLTPPSFVARLTKQRDYKPKALQYLKQAGEVLMTGDGKLYMVEEKRDGRETKS
jgi:hypothetical protein